MRNIIFIALFLIYLCSCSDNSIVIKKNADLYLGLKEYDKAIPLYKKAIQLDPQYEEAIHNLGKVYEEQGFYEAAINYYTEAIGIDSLYAHAYRSRGYAFYKLDKLMESIRDYRKSLDIEPKNVSALGNLSYVYELDCDFENARKYYYKTLDLDSTRYWDMDDLASIEFDLGNYDTSIALCYKILKYSDEKWDRPHATLALSYIGKNLYDSAIVHLNKALEYNPNWCHYYNNRGYSYSCLGNEKEAIKNYNKAIEINSKDPSYFLNRADSKRFLGFFKDAIVDYDMAIELSKEYEGYNCGICYYNRASAKLELGDRQGYENDIRSAQDLGYPEKHKQFSNLGEKAKFYNSEH
ncbi:MAG: tetratricopeptide repeat protein [Eubacteriales bacterium]